MGARPGVLEQLERVRPTRGQWSPRRPNVQGRGVPMAQVLFVHLMERDLFPWKIDFDKALAVSDHSSPYFSATRGAVSGCAAIRRHSAFKVRAWRRISSKSPCRGGAFPVKVGSRSRQMR